MKGIAQLFPFFMVRHRLGETVTPAPDPSRRRRRRRPAAVAAPTEVMEDGAAM